MVTIYISDYPAVFILLKRFADYWADKHSTLKMISPLTPQSYSHHYCSTSDFWWPTQQIWWQNQQFWWHSSQYLCWQSQQFWWQSSQHLCWQNQLFWWRILQSTVLMTKSTVMMSALNLLSLLYMCFLYYKP